MLLSLSCLIAALLLDRLLGEPRRLHPLIGFGNMAHWLEKLFRSDQSAPHLRVFISGTFAWACAVVPITLFFVCIHTWLKDQHIALIFAINSIGLYFCIGARSLEQHVLAIRNALLKEDLPDARLQLSKVVSRDTAHLDPQPIASAAVETTLENGNDAIFAALFWFMVGGLPLAIAYRLMNTLDAMWGYKNDRYFYFGKFAARADDVMNFIPARLTALSYCLAGNFTSGWRCWQQQAKLWKSPNAGPVMAAGAGALCISIGGNAIYHGNTEYKPTLGMGPATTPPDIDRALQLIRHSLFIWVIVITLIYFILYVS